MNKSLSELNDKLLAIQKAKEEMEQEIGESLDFIDLVKKCSWRIHVDAFRTHLVVRDTGDYTHDFYLKFNSLSPRTDWELIHGVDSYDLDKNIIIMRDRNNPNRISIAFIGIEDMANFIEKHDLMIDIKHLQYERDGLAKWLDNYDYLISLDFRSDE